MSTPSDRDRGDLPVSFAPLRDQLLAAAGAFAGGARSLGAILGGLVDDVERAFRESLEIFPVCHHSPSSALHMARRLAARPPLAIFMECCEDMRPLVEGLRDCRAPVAFQAFAPTSEHFPAAWSPLSLVCPLTEFSAEYQAMAYALENPGVELHFVDRSADHVFQWMPQDPGAMEAALPDDPDAEDQEAGMHGSAVGVEMGSLMPSFDLFRETLLKNARVQHFSEWWDQYVEEAVIDGDYSTYRQVLFLVGSLFRRLGTAEADRAGDELRERHMWTRIKQGLNASAVDPRDALYICGAAHAASRVAEFGLSSESLWDIPPRTATTWLHGILPSSYSAISHQFGHPRGAITLAEARWRKALARVGLKAFAIPPRTKGRKAAAQDGPEGEVPKAKKARSVPKPISTPPPAPEPSLDRLLGYLQDPPRPVESDAEELIKNCVKIVELARSNGYIASTADGIATYQTAILLANLRNRRHPTPYDFRDAAVTCIEKESVPGKRDVARLCDILLGGDRVGRIGFDSLPPLARDVYARLSPLPISLDSRTIQRALLDFRKAPELLPCADLLWKLRYLLPQDVVRPIMGRRELGHVPQQESWDVAIGKSQGAVIQLGYEGVTVEHVIERRLRQAAFNPEARAADGLRAAEEGLLFLGSVRVVEELGDHAVDLLMREPDARQAREIHTRVTRLVHYYRTTESGLPAWLERFVTGGYSHYATMLPNGFADRGVPPGDLAAMLRFIFTLESLALSLGCDRSQLVIAIRQSGPVAADPPKLSILWAAECVLGLREATDLRAKFDALAESELSLPALPDYLEGLLLALAFTPVVGGLTVEFLSKAFERLPDRLLMPWMPKLLRMLRPHSDSAVPILVKEAAAVFPRGLDSLEAWTAPWDRGKGGDPVAAGPDRSDGNHAEREASRLLAAFPATTNALAIALGVPVEWTQAARPVLAPDAASDAVRTLLRDHPQTTVAAASALG